MPPKFVNLLATRFTPHWKERNVLLVVPRFQRVACLQKPETVEGTAGPTPASKAKRAEPKIKEDKEEEVKDDVEDSGKTKPGGNEAEPKAEPMDEADGPAVSRHGLI